MFSKASRKTKDKPEAKPSLPSAGLPEALGDEAKSTGIPSIISPDLRIVGDLTSAGDIQVDGSVEGDITSRTLTIGENASVTGRVWAETMRVCGHVDGELKAQTVVVARTARVNGDIIHESIEIEAGAFIEGSIRRMSDDQPTPARTAVTETKVQDPLVTNGSGDAVDVKAIAS